MCIMSLSVQKKFCSIFKWIITMLTTYTNKQGIRQTKHIWYEGYHKVHTIIWYLIFNLNRKAVINRDTYLDLRSLDTVVMFLFAGYLYLLLNIWSPLIQKQTLHLFSFYPVSYTIYSHCRLEYWVLFTYTLMGV